MNVTIQIHYIEVESETGILQRGSFPLKGKKREQVAYNWWRQIKREMTVEIAIEQVIADGEDITELVMKLEKAPLD
jgi:lysylphosphatidylglycerol synthetase-like protein (DUF2156 family)